MGGIDAQGWYSDNKSITFLSWNWDKMCHWGILGKIQTVNEAHWNWTGLVDDCGGSTKWPKKSSKDKWSLVVIQVASSLTVYRIKSKITRKCGHG